MGLFKNKLNQPITLPMASVKASFLLIVVNVLLKRMPANTIVIKYHFNFALKDGFGYFIPLTYNHFYSPFCQK